MKDMRELAERVDRFMRGYDPYGYADSDWSLNDTLKMLKMNPLKIIRGLLTILEEMED